MKKIKINLRDLLPNGTIALSIINTARENELPLYLDEEHMTVYGPIGTSSFINQFIGTIEEVTDEKA